MQARFGSHGDYPVIALCPNSPQECFELAVRSFNLAEKYRVPVMLMHGPDDTVVPIVRITFQNWRKPNGSGG